MAPPLDTPLTTTSSKATSFARLRLGEGGKDGGMHLAHDSVYSRC
jgi:hypothetical protein